MRGIVEADAVIAGRASEVMERRNRATPVGARPGNASERALALLCLPLLLMLVATCACSAKPSVREWSGFLHDYSGLRLGGPGQLPFIYRNPDARWTSYDKVLMEPVALWRSGSKSLAQIPEDDLLELVAHFERAVRTRLGAGFEVVDQPQAGTVRLRLAITDARASDPVVDVLAPTLAEAARNGKTGPLGKELSAFIDAAVIEGEVRDAMTGELLAQGIDRRASGAPPPLPTWEALDRGLAFWADGTFSGLEARAHGR
jgi:hypothetical protein